MQENEPLDNWTGSLSFSAQSTHWSTGQPRYRSEPSATPALDRVTIVLGPVDPLVNWTQEIRKLSYFCAEIKFLALFHATPAKVFKQVPLRCFMVKRGEGVSINQRVYQIFKVNPEAVFSVGNLLKILNDASVKTEILTTILTRLYCKGIILRTRKQLTNGHLYSLSNIIEINKQYYNYILPYPITDKEKMILSMITEDFEQLNENNLLKPELKYCSSLFLASLVGFSMTDGSLDDKLTKVSFFIRYKKDVDVFLNEFKQHFPHERFFVRDYQTHFGLELSKASHFSKKLSLLGAPKGNKVMQPFLVPEWVYNGPREVKRAFLSAVFGGEGSAPFKNRWRIQFVLSKSEEYLQNLLDFLNQIRSMLDYFGIKTTFIQVRKQKGRHFHGRFYVTGRENIHKFYNELTFSYASEKQEALNKLIIRDGKPHSLVNTSRAQAMMNGSNSGGP